MSPDPEQLFSRVFGALMDQWEATKTFRMLAKLGLPSAEAQLARTNDHVARQIAVEPEYEQYFTDKAGFFQYVGGTTGFARGMTVKQLSTFLAAADAASIVFAHSALDAAVGDLCEVAALIAPDDWQPWLDDKKVPLSRVRTAQFEELRAEVLASHLAALKRESLLKRVDRLYALCKPPADLSLMRDYDFNRDRLESIDRRRQAIIHGEGIGTQVENVDDALAFLFNTGFHLTFLLNWKYGVRVNPMDVLDRGRLLDVMARKLRGNVE